MKLFLVVTQLVATSAWQSWWPAALRAAHGRTDAPRIIAPPHMATPQTLDGRSLLLQFASRRTAEAAKDEALKALMESDDRDALLDAALAEMKVMSTAKPLFSVRRWPVPLPSRRAAIGTFDRLMENMESEEPGSGARFQEGEAPRRRRYLLVLLRQLRTRKGVWALESEARRRDREATSMAEMLKRTPEELETPKYEVLAERGVWEVRQYSEFSVATTARDRAVQADGVKLQSSSMGGAGAFQSLAGYILGGKNEASERMAMTTPVLSGADGDSMSFVLPSRYWEGEAAPVPLDEQVVVASRGGGVLEVSDTLACMWFGGFAGSTTVAEKRAALLEAVQSDAEWELADEAQQPLLFQYNDPFTPPWARRSEVAVPIRRSA